MTLNELDFENQKTLRSRTILLNLDTMQLEAVEKTYRLQPLLERCSLPYSLVAMVVVVVLEVV